MDIVEQEIVASLSRAMYDCNDARAEELYKELRAYRDLKKRISK